MPILMFAAMWGATFGMFSQTKTERGRCLRESLRVYISRIDAVFKLRCSPFRVGSKARSPLAGDALFFFWTPARGN